MPRCRAGVCDLAIRTIVVLASLPGKSREERVENGRFKRYTYDDLITRDKANLDIAWLKDPSLDDSDALLPPQVIAREIMEDLQSALSELAAITEALPQEEDPGDSFGQETGT